MHELGLLLIVYSTVCASYFLVHLIFWLLAFCSLNYVLFNALIKVMLYIILL